MHELSLVASLFEIIERQTREHRAAKIIGVRVSVGRMSGIVPELLESAFEAYKKGTRAETAKLEIVIVPVKSRCRRCRRVFRPDTDAFHCPHCGSDRWTMIEGTDIVLDKIEIETG